MSNSIIRKTSLFFSDIVGYSSMIAHDEKFALHLLDEHDLILKTQIKNNVLKDIDSPEVHYNLFRIYNELQDIDKSKDMLDFHPQTDIEVGLDKFINWYNNYRRDMK